MIKKNLLLIIVLLFSITLISCDNKKITIDLKESNLELNVGEVHKINYETNDESGLDIKSSDDKIVKVLTDGKIEALSKGNVVITLTSKTDLKKEVTLNVKVTERNNISLEIINNEINLQIEEEILIEYTTTDLNGVIFSSSNTQIVSVDDNGKIKGLKLGSAIITITSKTDSSVSKSITINVLEETISLNIKETLLMGSVVNKNANSNLIFESSDNTILEVLEDNSIKALKEGVATIKATSTLNDSNFSTIEVRVVDHVVVLEEATETFTLDEINYKLGETLFKNLNDLVERHERNLIVKLLSGTYNEDVTFGYDITINGYDNNKVTGKLNINNKNTNISDVNFEDNAQLNIINVDKFTFKNNNIKNINNDFLTNDGVILEFDIESNNFNNITGTAINLNNIAGKGNFFINKNIINNSLTAINLKFTEKFDRKTLINLYRNKIDNTNVAFNIDLGEKNKTGSFISYARFNEVTNYETAIKGSSLNLFEFTLNYWGTENIDLTKFENIEEKMLLGYYKDVSNIVSEKNYKPNSPLYFEVLNPIEEIYLGETYKYEYISIPYSITPSIRWIVSEVGHVNITGTGFITPIESGKITISAYPSTNKNIEVKFDLEILTDPGIHLTPSVKTQGLLVGTEFNIKATPFPYNKANDEVIFTTSNNDIATIDNLGNVNIISEGIFTIKAALKHNTSIYEEMEFESYSELDENNIMDFIIMTQMQYLTQHQFNVYGAGYDYTANHYESVARFLFGDVNVTNIKQDGTVDYIGISPGVRSGAKKNSNISEEYKFNEENIVWIVVHETANTSTASNAYSHHKYLINRTSLGQLDYVSWHMTMDSEELYQHIPHDEVAWHAGDGSTLPGAGGQYLGGGNRNGIGIEMSVNDDGNILKTWQRTAKHAASLLNKYNMPFSQLKYHQSFSGKSCPQSMIRGGFQEMFEEMALNELKLIQNFENLKSIELITENNEYIDSTGVIIKNPEKSITLTYQAKVTFTDGTYQIKDFNTYLPGYYK